MFTTKHMSEDIYICQILCVYIFKAVQMHRWTQPDNGHTLLFHFCMLDRLHINEGQYSFKCSTGCAFWTSCLKKYSFSHTRFSTCSLWLCRISFVRLWIWRKVSRGERIPDLCLEWPLTKLCDLGPGTCLMKLKIIVFTSWGKVIMRLSLG